MKPLRTRCSCKARCGLTVIELVVIAVAVLVVVGLLIPAVRVTRGPARRMQCSNNLKQHILAAHNYESAYGRLPAAVGGTGVGLTPLDGNANRLSGLVVLLPFWEQTNLFNKIAQEQTINGVRYPPFGPAPWIEGYTPWTKQLSFMRCPSDEAPQSTTHAFGRTTYAFSVGDVSMNLHRPTVARDAFAAGL